MNQIMDFDDGIKGDIGSCLYNFISHLKTGHAPTMAMAEVEETHVPISIKVSQLEGLSQH